MIRPKGTLSQSEFVALVAFLTMVIAVGTDFMLTSLDEIGRDLGATSANAPQLIIPIFLLGTGLGQLFAGPASDYLGRKPVILLGLSIFIFGSILCYFAQSFETMLMGRFIQGIGTAGPRTVTMAMVRDRFAGPEMARIMSFVMGVFVVVPALAPSLGKIVSDSNGWRALFVLFVLHALIAGLWLGLRQPESNPKSQRRRFSMRELAASLIEVSTHPVLLRYSIMAGAMFGAFFAYISSSPQIYDVVFDDGARFTLYFAVLALSLGLASFANGKLVTTLGMRPLVTYALTGGVGLTAIYLCLVLFAGLGQSLPLFLTWCVLYFFCQGITLGNLGAIALEPLPHQAGSASTIFSMLSTLIGILIATPLGLAFDGTVIPLTCGFLVCSGIALIMIMTDGSAQSK